MLSLDTANSIEYGNLHHQSTTWGKLVQLYQQGKISATLTGSPCETWSAERHHNPDADGEAQHQQPQQPRRRMPRPLRDATRLLGKKFLSPRELRQLQQGTFFFMQSLLTMAWSLVSGAIYLSEHPALPILEEAASIWKTPWVLLLCAHPEVKLHTVGQWRWGCSVTKPTGLLAMRLPRFGASMYSRQDPSAKKPVDQAIGIGTDGHFKTSAHKEYPSGFCDALAGTILDELSRRSAAKQCRECTDTNSDLLTWLKEASVQCGEIRNGSWLPDYQGD